MAHIKSIWFNEMGQKTKTMRVYVALRPSGEANINVDLPDKFYDTVMQIAQTAADCHEAVMRAEILGDEANAKV